MRLPPSLLRAARQVDPLLLPLLRTCRDLNSARNELRWLREHVSSRARRTRDAYRFWNRLRQLCLDRGRGVPLQYILGSEHFGDLEILCRPGVLIPRQETANQITHLVQRLHHGLANKKPGDANPLSLRVLDLCTGSGCMAFHFHHEMAKLLGDQVRCSILGIDISARAVDLAMANRLNLATRLNDCDINFARADILDKTITTDEGDAPPLNDVLESKGRTQWDIIIANPPYISPKAFNTTTSHSVRTYEPKLALVPPALDSKNDEEQADLFYPTIMSIAQKVGAKIVLMELGDDAQAKRLVHKIGMKDTDGDSLRSIWGENPYWQACELWHDILHNVGPETVRTFEESVHWRDGLINHCGIGNVRSLFFWRGDAGSWLGTQPFDG